MSEEHYYTAAAMPELGALLNLIYISFSFLSHPLPKDWCNSVLWAGNN